MNEATSYKVYSCLFFVLFLICYIIFLKSIISYLSITNVYFYPVSFFLLLGADYVISAIYLPRLSVLARRLIILLLVFITVLSLLRFMS